ncbi:SRPBCC family protein [Evansella halocellulosilytica]|uniref:SRPBCC family protein n=1 Tax=Evansella halocellulosilytica TaxID=2011013 RepID=UPI000BB7DDDB|nr:SRPBCC family protein [Evansella halocellulosilytica]
MADFHEEVIINETIDDVYRFIANPKNATYYFANVVEVEKLSEGQVEVGSRYKEFRHLANRKVGAVLEVTEYEPEKSYGVKSDANGLEVTYHYSFQEVDQKTKVTFNGNVIAKKWTMKLMRPLLVKMINREDGDHLKSIKKVLEDVE